MGAIKKAGIPFTMKVNTKADKMGKESSFNMYYIKDSDGTVTHVTAPFREFEVDITPFSTTASAGATLGEKVIVVVDASGFTSGSTAFIGGNYYRVSGADTTANTITLKRGLETAVATNDSLALSGRTGTYGCDVTVPAAGDYTFHITNFDIGMDNEPAPVEVHAANVDDVKTLLDTVKAEVDVIKATTDVLDTSELNNIHEEVVVLQSTMDSVHTLLKDNSDVYIEISGDETANISVDDALTGDTSGATGVVQYVSYDATTSVTKVTIQSVTGTFQTGETINNGTVSTTGTISLVSNNVINSVIEFVQEIDNLLKSSSGLDALKNLNADIEAMLNGDATLTGGSANPTAGKGLIAIFDSIASTHTDLTALKTLAEEATNGFAAVRTAVDAGRASIEGKLDALIDTTDANSLVSKIDAIKTVVDANKATLEDAGFGLNAIRSAIISLDSALTTHDTTVGNRFTAVDNAISTLSSDLAAQTAHLDTRFDAIDSKLNAMDNVTQYSVFA